MNSLPIVLALAVSLASARAQAAPDILIADFEGGTYGAWKSTGNAFGPASKGGVNR